MTRLPTRCAPPIPIRRARRPCERCVREPSPPPRLRHAPARRSPPIRITPRRSTRRSSWRGPRRRVRHRRPRPSRSPARSSGFDPVFRSRRIRREVPSRGWRGWPRRKISPGTTTRSYARTVAGRRVREGVWTPRTRPPRTPPRTNRFEPRGASPPGNSEPSRRSPPSTATRRPRPRARKNKRRGTTPCATAPSADTASPSERTSRGTPP